VLLFQAPQRILPYSGAWRACVATSKRTSTANRLVHPGKIHCLYNAVDVTANISLQGTERDVLWIRRVEGVVKSGKYETQRRVFHAGTLNCQAVVGTLWCVKKQGASQGGRSGWPAPAAFSRDQVKRFGRALLPDRLGGSDWWFVVGLEHTSRVVLDCTICESQYRSNMTRNGDNLNIYTMGTYKFNLGTHVCIMCIRVSLSVLASS
jgi:hypothetical protein